jgi:hypothetical protein
MTGVSLMDRAPIYWKISLIHKTWNILAFPSVENLHIHVYVHICTHCTAAEFLDKIQIKALRVSSLLFTVTSTALSWDLYFFKLTQPLRVSRVLLLYTVKEKGGKPGQNHSLFPLVEEIHTETSSLSENSQDCAQKSKRNCTFMNSALVLVLVHTCRNSADGCPY